LVKRGVALAVEQARRPLFQRRQLGVCQRGPPGERDGAFERRRVVVRPRALKIGLAVGGPPDFPGRLLRREGHRHRQNRDRQQNLLHGTLRICVVQTFGSAVVWQA
jgi:hypothetical protein